MEKENIIGIDALYNSMNKCTKGVKWKGTVAYFRHHWPDEIQKLNDELVNGTYKERRAKFFTVTEPKLREIMSIHFRDRVFQRSLNDIAIYPQASKHFIQDNFACQKGKGTQAARNKLKEYLHKFEREYGLDGYILKIDIKGYYPNMSHQYAESMLRNYLDKETYEMAIQVLAHLPGDIGYNPGSQIVQIVGITALDHLDHFIKEQLNIKYYIRYMDDFILIHHDKHYLQDCLKSIQAELNNIKMKTNDKKTYITKISNPILFLGFIYHVTNTGKIIILADLKKIKHERKKIQRMVALVNKGKMTKRAVDKHFKSYKASVRYGNSHNLIYRLNRWYESLWKGQNYEQTK